MKKTKLENVRKGVKQNNATKMQDAFVLRGDAKKIHVQI